MELNLGRFTGKGLGKIEESGNGARLPYLKVIGAVFLHFLGK